MPSREYWTFPINTNKKGIAEDEMVRWHHQLKDMNLSKLQEIMKDREAWQSMGSWRAVHDLATEQQPPQNAALVDHVVNSF